jgi:alpha-ketoglutarate-dependent taurine dioxygenase
MNDYPGVTVRFIQSHETRAPAPSPRTPLVLEARDFRDAQTLQHFLSAHSAKLMTDLSAHRALLLRGFDLASPKLFEDTVLSLRGMRGMGEVWMPVQGRTLVEGTRFVLHTNTLYKTGGTLNLSDFHSEHYYGADVPRYISFMCEVPSRMGGETGIIDTVGVYSALSASLKKKLEERVFLSTVRPLAQIAQYYGISEERARTLSEALGFTVDRSSGMVLMFKPTVFEDATNGERGINLHFHGELRRQGLESEVRSLFANDYRGFKWFLHRLAWKYPSLIFLGQADSLVRSPGFALRALWQMVSPQKRPDSPGVPSRYGDRAGKAFEGEDIRSVARALRENFYSFEWRSGDVLILDNMRTAHTGMPGRGPRSLKALISNPIEVKYRNEGSGVHVYRDDPRWKELGSQARDLLARDPQRTNSAQGRAVDTEPSRRASP